MNSCRNSDLYSLLLLDAPPWLDSLNPRLSLSFHASTSMDPAGLQVMNSRLPFDPTADVTITHTVQQGRTTDNDNDNNQSRGLILNHYLRGPSVGKGQHGTVYKCYDLTRNNVEVVRTISSSSLSRARPPDVSFFLFFPSRLSRSCHDITPVQTVSTSSRGKRSRVQGLTSLSPTTSVAKNTKSKRR